MKQRMTVALSAIAIVFAVVAVPLVGPLSTRAQEVVSEVEEESISPSVDNERSQKTKEKLGKVKEKALLPLEDVPRLAPGVSATAIPDDGNRYGTTTYVEQSGEFGMIMPGIPANAAQWLQEVRKTAVALRDAETDEDKTKAEEHLTQLIERYFDKDMDRREEELTKIEERVRKLREQLDLRWKKKQEIINLQIQVAVNEAEGLGFFSQPSNFMPLVPPGGFGGTTLDSPGPHSNSAPEPAVPHYAPGSEAPLLNPR